MGVPRGKKPALCWPRSSLALAPGVALASQSDDPVAFEPSSFHGTSPDGTHAYIQTREQLVRADTDQMRSMSTTSTTGRKAGLDRSRRRKPGRNLPLIRDPRTCSYFESCDAASRGPRAAGCSSVQSLRSSEALERPLRLLPRRRIARVHATVRSPRPRTTPSRSSRTRIHELPLATGLGRRHADLDRPGRPGRWMPEQRRLPLRQPDRRRGTRCSSMCDQATRGRRHR